MPHSQPERKTEAKPNGEKQDIAKVLAYKWQEQTLQRHAVFCTQGHPAQQLHFAWAVTVQPLQRLTFTEERRIVQFDCRKACNEHRKRSTQVM
jgi:hypothetical protein